MPLPTTRDVHIDQALSSISIAYRNENYIADQIFPRVPVVHKSDYYFIYGQSAWLRDEVKIRAPGTEAAEGDFDITSASYVALTWAISKVVSDEMRKNADVPIRPDVDATDWCVDALLRAQERRIANKTTGGSGLWSYSTTPTTAWTADTSDPWGDIDSAVNGVISKIGRMPNVAVMSWDVWRNLRQHPDFLDRIKYTRPTGRVEPSDLQTWFGFSKVLIGNQLIDTGPEGGTTATAYIWGDQFWCGYVPQTPSLMTPAAGYVLEWQAREVRRYRLHTRHADKIEAQHSVAELISASEAGAVLYNAV